MKKYASMKDIMKYYGRSNYESKDEKLKEYYNKILEYIDTHKLEEKYNKRLELINDRVQKLTSEDENIH